MTKKVLSWLLVCLSLTTSAQRLYTTTIDYLDYVFYDNVGPKEYYSLEC